VEALAGGVAAAGLALGGVADADGATVAAPLDSSLSHARKAKSGRDSRAIAASVDRMAPEHTP
jgi:hypothetical protein